MKELAQVMIVGFLKKFESRGAQTIIPQLVASQVATSQFYSTVVMSRT